MDLEDEENMLMILAMRAKRPKHGGSVFGRRKLWRERIEGHNKLIHSYFADEPIFPKSG
jgi:hypothetical protein